MRYFELSEVDLAWLACAIDGEGSIIHHYNSRTKYECWSINVYNTNRAFVEKAAKLLGGKIEIRTHTNPKWATTYTTKIASRKKLRELLPKLIPYLIIKADRAKQALKWASVNDEELKRRRFEGLSKGAKKRWEDAEYRKKISESVKRQWKNPLIRKKMIENRLKTIKARSQRKNLARR